MLGSMRVTAKTDYAVRGCLELASHRADGMLKADQIAAAQQIPGAFMLSILGDLRAAGIVESRRGADGGYRLALDPADVALADVIRAIDGPLASIAGVQPEDVDYRGASVHLRDAWVALRVAMRSVLEATTLADVVAGDLPEVARELLSHDDAYVTRPLPGRGAEG